MTQPPGLFPLPVPYRRRRKLWPWLAGLAALVFIAGVFVFAFWVTSDDDAPATATAAPLGVTDPETQLRQAFSACHSGNLADDDHTLVIDSQGEEYDSGTDTFEGLSCTLTQLNTPESAIARMEATRALDGMQSTRWDGFEASWTYHPDNGLDLIITEGG